MTAPTPKRFTPVALAKDALTWHDQQSMAQHTAPFPASQVTDRR